MARCLAGTADGDLTVGRHLLAVQHVVASFSGSRSQVHPAARVLLEEGKKSSGAASADVLTRCRCAWAAAAQVEPRFLDVSHTRY